MPTQSMTGRGGTATVNGVVIPITKWSSKANRNLADATDSANYDVATGQTWTDMASGVVSLELTLEGNYDLATTSAQITSKIKTDGPFPVVLQVNRTTTYLTGNFYFSDVETSLEVPGGTMVSWTANAKNSGIVTLP